MIRALLLSATLALVPLAVAADAAFSRMYDLLSLDSYLEITRAEGIEDFTPLTEDFIGLPPDSVLNEQITQIYDVPRMRDALFAEMKSGLTEQDIAGITVFAQSDMGQQIISLEIAARRAMSDPDVEAAARAAWARAEEDRPWLTARVQDLIEVSDLVERNVAGSLNSHLRFYQGLADGDGLDMSEAEMLAQVYGQEPDIRADTSEWLGGYLMLAYDPLGEETIEKYITFWSSPPGRALNSALFDGFNKLFDDISYATARILAVRMGAQEL